MQFLWYKKGTSIRECDGGNITAADDVAKIMADNGCDTRYVVNKDGPCLVVDPIPNDKYRVFWIEDDLWEEACAFDEGLAMDTNYLNYDDMFAVQTHCIENEVFCLAPQYEWEPSSPDPEIYIEIKPLYSDPSVVN